MVAGAPQIPTCSHNPPQYIPFPTPTQVPHSCSYWYLVPIRDLALHWAYPMRHSLIVPSSQTKEDPTGNACGVEGSWGRPVSRVLSGACRRFTGYPFLPSTSTWAIIYLDPHVTVGFVQPTRSLKGTSRPPLASEFRSYLALLPMAVTWPSTLLPTPVGSYPAFSPLPGNPAVIFCGPLRDFHRPGIIRHRALRSADFPQVANTTRDRPVDPTIICIIPPQQYAVNFDSIHPSPATQGYMAMLTQD